MDLHPNDLLLSRLPIKYQRSLLFDKTILCIFPFAYTISYPKNQVKSCSSLGMHDAPDKDSYPRWGLPTAGIFIATLLSAMAMSLSFLFLEHFLLILRAAVSQPHQEITTLKIRNVLFCFY